MNPWITQPPLGSFTPHLPSPFLQKTDASAQCTLPTSSLQFSHCTSIQPTDQRALEHCYKADSPERTQFCAQRRARPSGTATLHGQGEKGAWEHGWAVPSPSQQQAFSRGERQQEDLDAHRPEFQERNKHRGIEWLRFEGTLKAIHPQPLPWAGCPGPTQPSLGHCQGQTSTALGSSARASPALCMKNFFLTSDLNLPSFSLKPLPLVLSLSGHVKSRSLSCL